MEVIIEALFWLVKLFFNLNDFLKCSNTIESKHNSIQVQFSWSSIQWLTIDSMTKEIKHLIELKEKRKKKEKFFSKNLLLTYLFDWIPFNSIVLMLYLPSGKMPKDKQTHKLIRCFCWDQSVQVPVIYFENYFVLKQFGSKRF